MIASTLIGLGITLGAVSIALGIFVFALRSPGRSVGEVLRIFPDCLRLAVALYRDRTLPRSVRRHLRIALIYNLQPINLIPDAIPLIGFADNVAVLAWALRGAVRIAGPSAVGRHWTGSPESMSVLYRGLRLPCPDAGGSAREEWA